MKLHTYTRPTIVAATEFLGEALSQAKFDQLIVRLNLVQEIGLGSSKSVTAKCAGLAYKVTQDAAQIVYTVEGQITLAEAVVRNAVEATSLSLPRTEQKIAKASFLRGLALDGYVISCDDHSQEPWLRKALPEELDLPATDDEVHQLLKHFGFTVSMVHLDQAIDTHARGDLEAANSQLRSFLESLLQEIAVKIDPQGVLQKSPDNIRTLLASNGFLSEKRKEWTPDGKNYINGLFKMLHTDGSHPGLSDEDHSTFRLHLVLITGRTFLRRLQKD